MLLPTARLMEPQNDYAHTHTCLTACIRMQSSTALMRWYLSSECLTTREVFCQILFACLRTQERYDIVSPRVRERGCSPNCGVCVSFHSAPRMFQQYMSPTKQFTTFSTSKCVIMLKRSPSPSMCAQGLTILTLSRISLLTATRLAPLSLHCSMYYALHNSDNTP